MSSRERAPNKGLYEVSRAPRLEGGFPKSIFEVDAPTLLSLGVKSADAPATEATCVILEPARNDVVELQEDDFSESERDVARAPGSVFRFAPVTIQPISNPDDIPNLVRPHIAPRMMAGAVARRPEVASVPLHDAEETVVDETPPEPALSMTRGLQDAESQLAQLSEKPAMSEAAAVKRPARSDPYASQRPSPLPSPRTPRRDAREDVTLHAIPRVPLRDSFGELDEFPSAQRTPAPPRLQSRQTSKVFLIAVAALLVGGSSVWALLSLRGTPHPEAPVAATSLADTPPPPALQPPTSTAQPGSAQPGSAPPVSAQPALDASEPDRNLAPIAAHDVRDVKRAASAKKPNKRTSLAKPKTTGAAESKAATPEKKPKDPLGAGPVFKWGEG